MFAGWEFLKVSLVVVWTPNTVRYVTHVAAVQLSVPTAHIDY